MISIQLNGEILDCDTGTTVDQLVSQLNLQDKRLAVEINQQIIPRSTFAEHLLQAQDVVEIVQAIGGG